MLCIVDGSVSLVENELKFHRSCINLKRPSSIKVKILRVLCMLCTKSFAKLNGIEFHVSHTKSLEKKYAGESRLLG